MMRKTVSSLILALLCALSAEAGYDDMKKAYEAYQPPPYFDSQLRPPQPLAPPSTADPAALQADLARVHALRAKWEGVRATIADHGAFGPADPELTASIRAAGSDAQKAVALLRNNVSMELLEALVLFRDPAVLAARKELDAAIEKISQIEALDAVLRQYAAIAQGTMNGIGSVKGQPMMALSFPFPGVLSLKSRVVEKEVEIAALDLEIARRDAVTSMRKSFWNLIYIRKSQAITREILTMLTHLEAVATTRYEAGKTSYQDVVKISINKETIATNLETLQERERNLETRMFSQLDLPLSVRMGGLAVPVGFEPLPAYDRLFELAAAHRQEIQQTRARIAKMEHMVELAETMILPTFTSNLTTNENRAAVTVGSFNQGESFATTVAASRGAGLPKNPWYGSEDAYLRQTREKIEALKATLKRVENQTRILVRDAWFELDRSGRDAALFANSVVGLSRTSLDVSTRGYEAGKVAFADVFQAYDMWFKANLALERKRSDIGVYRAELERAVGRRLP